MSELLLASGSTLKFRATLDTFEQEDCGRIIPLPVTVDNPEQPFGHENTIKAALRRLYALMNHSEAFSADVKKLLSIESGLVKVGEDYFDIVVACMYDKDTHKLYSQSHKICLSNAIPVTDVELIAQMLNDPCPGGFNVTYGELASKKYHVPSNNWMNKLEKKDRRDQIVKALRHIRNEAPIDYYRELLSVATVMVPDFPVSGVMFQNLFPIFQNPNSDKIK